MLYFIPTSQFFESRLQLRVSSLIRLRTQQVLVEVLAPSTELRDRWSKFDHYRLIPATGRILVGFEGRNLNHRHGASQFRSVKFTPESR